MKKGDIMNWLRKKKLLKVLFNKTFVFYQYNNRWHFEVEISDKNSDLVKEYMNEIKENTK